MPIKLAELAKLNSARWAKAKLTRSSEFVPVAKRLVTYKPRLQAMERKTNVPWFVIAVIRQRECGMDAAWACNIANGQRWDKVTTIVPKGRGPFKSWEQAAEDALRNCHPYAAKWTDWSVGGMLTLLEQYNGLGYANRGRPSPYIWSGTDQYVKGKYIRDGVYDPEAIDKQLGCAGLIKAMMELDPSISFKGVRLTNELPTPTPMSHQEAPKKRGWLEAFLSLFRRA
jgi:lysozyme family protein